MHTNHEGHTCRIEAQRKTDNLSIVAPVSHAAIEEEAGDTYRLRLFASDGQAAGGLSALSEKIARKGYVHMFADIWQDKQVLVVSKLTRENAEGIIRLLEIEGILDPNDTQHFDASVPHPVNNKLRRDSLKWSGRFAMAASAAVAFAGIGQKDWNRVFTGLGFMAADSIVAVYGNGKGSIDFDELFRDMNRHFEANGVHLPQIATPEARMNTIEKVHHFIATHPVELNYSLGMLGGLGHIRSGVADYARSGAGISRITKGVLGAGGSAAVVFLDEDKSRKQDLKSFDHYLTHPADIPQGISDFVLASPIRFKGMVSSIYSALYLTDSLEEKKKMKLWASQRGGLYDGKDVIKLRTELGSIIQSDQLKSMDAKSIAQANELQKGISELERREKIAKTFFGGKVTPYLSAFTGLCYIASSLLASMSSKNRDPSYEQADEYERMYSMAAQTIMSVPEADRELALNQIATYLSAQKDVKEGEVHAPAIIQEVARRVDLLEQSPWLPTSNQEVRMSL